MSTVYLHIGMPKTGTTALQYFLPANQAILNTYGICYPDLGYRYPNIGVHRNAHFLIAVYRDEEGNREYEREQREYEQGLDRIAQLAQDYSKIILSDEEIWRGFKYYRKNFWANLKKDLNKRNLDLKIIAYVRRQDLWTQSFWAQKVKGGGSYDINEYMKTSSYRGYILDYYKYMNMLSDILGKEALILRVYEKGQFQGAEHTLHSDFLDIFGLQIADGFEIKKEIYNTRLEGNYLEIKRILNTLPEFHRKHPLMRTMNQVSIREEVASSQSFEEVSYFRPEQQLDFIKKYDAPNQKLAKEYLNREDGILFYEKQEELPFREIKDEELLRDVILVYGKAFDVQEERNIQLENEIKSLKEKNINEIKALQSEIGKTQSEIGKMQKQIKDLQTRTLWSRIKGKIKYILRRVRVKGK